MTEQEKKDMTMEEALTRINALAAKKKSGQTLTEEELLDLECDELLSHVCQKRQGELLRLLIQKAQLSKQDIHLLQKLLQEKEIDAPEQLACTCIPGQCRCCHH